MLKNIEIEAKKVTFLLVYLENRMEMIYLCTRFQIKHTDNQRIYSFQYSIKFQEEIASI